MSKAYKVLAITERERIEKGGMVISGQLSKLTPGMVSHHSLSITLCMSLGALIHGISFDAERPG